VSLWTAPEPLVLASRSVARAGLLGAAAIPFEVMAADIDERAVERTEATGDPENVAIRLAEAKAMATSHLVAGRLVLGADQTLSFAGRALHKPANLQAAREQLQAMRGRPHRLISAAALVRAGIPIWRGWDEAELVMRDFSDVFLDRYLELAGGSATTSVGAYQIEGLGIHLFAAVEGDHATILGLPLLALLAALRDIGVLMG
jgi:septum formation protein